MRLGSFVKWAGHPEKEDVLREIEIMGWIIAIGIFVIILVAVLSVLTQATQNSKGKNHKNSSDFNYQLQPVLLSPAERSFYGVLQQAVGDHFLVFAKVRVADVLSPQKGMQRSDWQRAFNKISAKHFDFVLCTKDTLSVEAAIELDDKSHNKPNRVQRDNFLNQAATTAGLSLIRFPVQASYSVQSIKSEVLTPLGLGSMPKKVQ